MTSFEILCPIVVGVMFVVGIIVGLIINEVKLFWHKAEARRYKEKFDILNKHHKSMEATWEKFYRSFH